MKHILFVCTGNTCRSSMAKGILEAGIAAVPLLLNQIIVDSAGISAFPGVPASYFAISVLKEEWSIDISSHRAKLLDQNIAAKADIILTMTISHKAAININYPNFKSKVFTLKEYISKIKPDISCQECHSTYDIADPYGSSNHTYRLCANEIKEAIDLLILKLESEFAHI